MTTPAEIAYRETMRSLDGQAQDLLSIREHLSIVLSAAGIAAAFLGGQADGRGPGFWVAVGAFGVDRSRRSPRLPTCRLPMGIRRIQLVTEYVDPNPQPESAFVMRELAVHGADNYQVNRETLERLWRLQSRAFLLFAVEVIALLANIALEAK